MPELPLTPAVQHWIYVVLIWVGFGALAGLLATVLFPFRRPAGPFWAVVLGISGSAVGLCVLSWLFPGRVANPISPLGFLAATVGSLALLALYRLGEALFAKRGDAEADEP
ncbi:MAG: GlsB/YeaQ/YmgE family stress response membrane protein [Planctomycetaceae bacterium]|nr:GlsB/YeaQ/YmgE family stress response membrane protein [Planctomycetaceae bacterium]